MSHEVETMAYANETPWHGLGRKVSNDLTPEQMMKAARVDWKVHEAPSYATYKDQTIPTGQKVLIRSDTGAVLSNVGQDWHIVQNKDAFKFFTEYVLAGDMSMETAGSLKGGQIVWALAKINESFDIFGGDQVDAYLLFSNPHQYGKCIDVRFTPIRVVCNNTLTLSLSTASKRAVRVNHATPFDAELVKETLGLAHKKFAEYKEMAEFLGSRRYSIDLLKEYYKEVFPHTTVKKGVENVGEVGKKREMTNNAKKCFELVGSQPGAEYAEGSWWQAFNSVTYFTDQIQGRDAENRLHNQCYGKNQLVKTKALDKALKYARKAA